MKTKFKTDKIVTLFSCLTALWIVAVAGRILLKEHWKRSLPTQFSLWQEVLGLLILTVLAVTLLARLMRFIVDKGPLAIRICILCFFVLLIAMQIILIVSWDVAFSWRDINTTHSVASRLYAGEGFTNREVLYMTHYQNNCGAVFIYSIFYRICALFVSAPGIKCMMVCSTVLLDLGICFIIATCGLIFGAKGKVIATFVSFAFSAFYLYALLPYTDVLAFCAVSVLTFLFFRYSTLDNKNAKLRTILLFGIVLGFGSFAKGSVLILLAAVLVYALLNSRARQSVRNQIRFYLMAGAIVLGCTLAINVGGKALVNHPMNITKAALEAKEFPMIHWLMLGSSDEGTYSKPDFLRTSHVDGKSQKTKMCLEETLHRYRERSLLKMPSYLLHKNAYRVWHGGTFFYGFAYKRKQSIDRFHGISYYVMRLRAQDGYTLPTVVIWVFEMFCIALALWTKRKAIGNYQFLLVCLIGINLFLNVWEANGRYLFQYVPILFPLIISGGLVINQAHTQLVSHRK